MTDVNRIVGEIRMLLQSVDRTAQPHLPALAEELSRACAEANDRLTRCAAYLRQGLRSEALQLAQAAPDLLDQVAALDFPERSEWDELALSYGWPKAAPLAIDLAEAVNEAYALEDPLQDLLRAHRRLALARGPLRARLDVMRQICALDPNNGIWAEDVRTLERVRFQQIEREVNIARAHLDAATLKELSDEAEAAGWLIAPPEALVSAVNGAIAHVAREQARKALRSLVEPLNQARAQDDVTLGRRLGERWTSLLEVAALGRRDTLAGETQAALDWLAEADRREQREDAFRGALNDLKQAIEAGALQPVVAEIEAQARAYGLHFPRELEAELHEHYQRLNRSTRRRNQLVLGAVGGATFLLVALVAWSNAAQQREREVGQDVARIEDLLHYGSVEEARSVLEKLEGVYPGVSREHDVVPIVDRLVEAEHRESERAAEFAAALAQVRDAPVLQHDVPALATARTLARLPAEKDEVERLARSRRTALEKERGRLTRDVTDRLAPIRERLPAIQASVERRPDDAAALNTLRAELRALEPDAEGASEEVKALFAVLSKRAREIEGTRAGLAEREQLLKELEKCAGAMRRPEHVKAYIAACERYTERFPRDARSRDMAKAMNAQPLWENIMGWTNLARSWTVPVTDLTPASAAERSRQLAVLGDDLSQFPDRDCIQRYRDYAQSRARLGDHGDESPKAQIHRLLSNPLVDKLSRITTTEDKTYYTRTPLRTVGAGVEFEKLINLECDSRPQHVNRILILKSGLAPQSKLAVQMAKSLERDADSAVQWDAKLLAILNLVRNDADLDPVLKAGMLKACLRAAAQGDSCLGEALKAHAERVDTAQADLDANWVDPDDPVANAERERLRPLLARLPAFDSCVQAAADARKRLESETAAYYEPVGFLVKYTDGRWHCRVARDNPAAGELSAIGPNSAWRPIGQWKANTAAPEIAAGLTDLHEGQLVFAQHRAR